MKQRPSRTNGKGLWKLGLALLLWLILAAPAFADIIYTVEEGDSAWSISIRFGVSLDDLYAANGWASDENPVLQIGQRIALPTEREGTESSAETSSETTYIVQSGDNPYIIAQRFEIETLALLEYNGLTEEDLIHPGRLLSIPPSDYRVEGTGGNSDSTVDETSAPEPLRYRVQAGDNPWVIARQFSINVQTLLSYNNMTENTLLHVGDELLIPAVSENLSSRSANWTNYTVKPGDTLSQIAQGHGVSAAALAEANNIGINSMLREGQQLLIPNYRSEPGAAGTPVTPPAPEGIPVPAPTQDYSGALTPIPDITEVDNLDDLSGWQSNIFDFTQIAVPEPSTPDPASITSGTLSVDGTFADGTPYHIYTVRRGDTISDVAFSFGITQSELMNRNGLDFRSALRIGRDLKISLPRPAAPAYRPGRGSGSRSISYGAPNVPVGTGSGTASGRSVVETAMQYLGTPYVWAGTSLTGGVDCSGFTMGIYAQFGVSLPHRASEQASCGTEVSYSDLQPGDLVMFHTTRSGISHVGIYIGNGDFIHSSSHSGGVVISPIDSGYYNQRFVCARRVL